MPSAQTGNGANVGLTCFPVGADHGALVDGESPANDDTDYNSSAGGVRTPHHDQPVDDRRGQSRPSEPAREEDRLGDEGAAAVVR